MEEEKPSRNAQWWKAEATPQGRTQLTLPLVTLAKGAVGQQAALQPPCPSQSRGPHEGLGGSTY